jgi:hypothetical protein
MAVSVPPVKMMKSISGRRVRAPAAPSPRQGRNWSVFFEIPASQKQRHSSRPVRTAREEGLKITVFPA